MLTIVGRTRKARQVLRVQTGQAELPRQANCQREARLSIKTIGRYPRPEALMMLRCDDERCHDRAVANVVLDDGTSTLQFGRGLVEDGGVWQDT